VGERVVAVGRWADITELADIEQGGVARTYVMITDRRLRWVEHYLANEASINLSDITSYSERTVAHRWAISLTHPSVEHRRLWPGRTMPADVAEELRAAGRLRDEPGPSRTRSSPSAVEILLRLGRSAKLWPQARTRDAGHFSGTYIARLGIMYAG